MRDKPSGRKRPGDSVAASGALLGIMLLPAIAGARPMPQAAAAVSNGAQTVQTTAPVSVDPAERGTRSSPIDDSNEAEDPTPSAMEAVSQYLQIRSSPQTSDAALTKSWNEFYGWRDARMHSTASSCRHSAVDIDDRA